MKNINIIEQSHLVREMFWPNDVFPVDPVTIANKMGIKVLRSDLPNTVSGALMKTMGTDPVILIHDTDSNNRKRFTIAHELGHYVYRTQSDKNDSEYEYVDFRDHTSSLGNDSEEIVANNFAANLLMPEEKIRELLHNKQSVISMAYTFGVSTESLKIRLRALGLGS